MQWRDRNTLKNEGEKMKMYGDSYKCFVTIHLNTIKKGVR